MEIQDGQGSGAKLGVNNDHQALMFGVVESELAAASRKGDAFFWQNATYDPDAGDTILLLANESRDRELVIDQLIIGSDTATVCTIHEPAYPTLAGTAVTGVNLNRRSTKIAEASAYCDETGNSQANVLSSFYLVAATAKEVDFQGALILGEHDCLAVDFVSAATAGYVCVLGHYRDIV